MPDLPQLADALGTYHLQPSFLALCLGLVACLLCGDRLGSALGNCGCWNMSGDRCWNALLLHKLYVHECRDSLTLLIGTTCWLQWFGDDVPWRGLQCVSGTFSFHPWGSD